MKKFTFHFSLLLGIGVSTLFLSACSTPDLTQPEIQDLYQKQLQSIENSFKTYFSPIPENYQTTTQLQLSSSKNSLDGQASYQSVKNTSLKKEEKSSISFQVDLKNFGENIPLQLSGALLSLYKDKEMYINIQDFSLFMGQGNAEAKFITLLAKQLANKRIALDKQEMIGISVIETPSYSEIIHNFLTLYTPLADITYTQDLQTKNRFLGTINTLSPDYLTSLETLLQLASDLAGIKLSRKNITLNPLKESTIEYQLPKKNTVEYTQRLYLTTETQTLTLYIEYIRGTLVVTL
ncbi:MAG: hypothetical protein LBD11_00825 [Candidatus Peribacteria bacterium]|jgi:hypothetical protein|nr:hypothetical protein [Candidatus Peribacteria bacterium]